MSKKQDIDLNHIFVPNFNPLANPHINRPLIVTKGMGIKVQDEKGTWWTDGHSSYMSVNIGYGRKEMAEVSKNESLKLNLYPPQSIGLPTINLANKLVEICPGNMAKVFFTSSGSEANETAIKLTKSYFNRTGEKDRFKIISRKGSYHGATTGLASLGFETIEPDQTIFPQYPTNIYVPLPVPSNCEFGATSPDECTQKCIDATKKIILDNDPDSIAAFIADLIPTKPGAAIPGPGYWEQIREICDDFGILLIIDEIVTGFGRTGKMFASEHWNISPDILTLAKGITSSYSPLAATLISEKIANQFNPPNKFFKHVFTSSGNPIGAALGLKNIEIIENENLIENSKVLGDYFKTQLESLQKHHSFLIKDVRGLGMLLALEFVSPKEIQNQYKKADQIETIFNKFLYTNKLLLKLANNILGIGPSLSIKKNEIDEIIEIIKVCLLQTEKELNNN
ncbi:MAG: aspartate aminotransferase family protein [SAR202 cluster bacterium]|nr:aspartate aminotransferase family protein [SAR202 cluster bacterium]|tara:strand:+ start:47282 stop:48640 length:1359 start_codon:yes stop_codon:yes gene_type:complete